MIEIKNLDSRPPKRGWAPGAYLCKCKDCQCHFEGDKRAWRCADCAYNLPEIEKYNWSA